MQVIFSLYGKVGIDLGVLLVLLRGYHFRLFSGSFLIAISHPPFSSSSRALVDPPSWMCRCVQFIRKHHHHRRRRRRRQQQKGHFRYTTQPPPSQPDPPSLHMLDGAEFNSEKHNHLKEKKIWHHFFITHFML